jgi:hypothetical protein
MKNIEVSQCTGPDSKPTLAAEYEVGAQTVRLSELDSGPPDSARHDFVTTVTRRGVQCQIRLTTLTFAGALNLD